MPSPYEHSVSSVETWGGKPDDYLPIHELIDSSKTTFPDARHRVLTHNAWFITKILEKIFGSAIKNSDGKYVPVRHIGEQHVREDYDNFMPSPQDFIMNMSLEPWMQNGAKGEYPPSHILMQPRTNRKRSSEVKFD